MKLLLKIAYVGTHYNGYQVQGDLPTVQRELNRATKEVFGYDCDIVGCSRTDSGVHAKMFCCCVTKADRETLETDIPAVKIPLALSAHLPEDIRVYEAKWVNEDFHPRYDVTEKTYEYRIWNASVMNPFEEGYAFHCPKKLDIAQMQDACELLLGTHDFSGFMAVGSKVESTVRTITEATIKTECNLLIFRVSADGFLYNMVRILAGTLVDVGHGKIPPENILKNYKTPNRTLAGPTLPSCGLCLCRVEYGDKL